MGVEDRIEHKSYEPDFVTRLKAFGLVVVGVATVIAHSAIPRIDEGSAEHILLTHLNGGDQVGILFRQEDGNYGLFGYNHSTRVLVCPNFGHDDMKGNMDDALLTDAQACLLALLEELEESEGFGSPYLTFITRDESNSVHLRVLDLQSAELVYEANLTEGPGVDQIIHFEDGASFIDADAFNNVAKLGGNAFSHNSDIQ
ncbi:MAG: hypothetical protein ACOCXP_04475 [Candidatus Dojkabacteria bacterium]